MIRRHVLAALAVGIEAGNDDAARVALGRADWALRRQARRRLERALLEAALATGVHTFDDPESARHVLRAAALIIRDGDSDEGLVDRGRVALAYGAAPVRAPLRIPVATVVVALLALATATTVGAATVLAIRGPVHTAVYERPTPPAPVGVFRDGGTPRRDAAIEEALGELSSLVAARVTVAGPIRLDPTARSQRLLALRAHHAFAPHGRALGRAWQALISSLGAWMELTSVEPRWRGASADLRARIEVVSDQLAAAGLGYYLEPSLAADHPRRGTGIFAYRIEEVAFVRANDGRVRVLGARRLDRGSAGPALLGLKAEELDDPVVLLDTVEAKVDTQILPVLAGHPFALGDDAWASSQRGRAAAHAAGDAIRRELLIALYTDASSLERATARCRALLVASVRHHEAQHRVDQDRGLAHPAMLASRLGDRPSEPFAVRTRFELSAYLSQIASDAWMPQLTLWNLARHGFRRSHTRSEEALVAVFVIEGLARRLGVPAAQPALRNGEIDRDQLAAIATQLAQRTTVELRSAAAALWGELFGAPLVRLFD